MLGFLAGLHRADDGSDEYAGESCRAWLGAHGWNLTGRASREIGDVLVDDKDNDFVGLLENVSGHTRDMRYDLLFMTDRVMALIVEHPADVPYRFSLTELFIGSKLGRQSERTERRRIADERRSYYREKPPDRLVGADHRNFEIPYSRISSVELRRGLFQSRLRFTVTQPEGRGVVVSFTLPREFTGVALNLVTRVLPAKLKKGR